MEKIVKLKKDDSNRAGYITLSDKQVTKQVTLDGYESADVKALKGEIVLDLDDEGRIVGIEILGDLLP